MNKKLRLLITALLTATVAAGVGWSPARAHESRSYIYVVNEGAGTDLVRTVRTPAGEVAPLGYFEVRPSGQTLSVHVDDHLTLDGRDVPVFIYSAGKTLFSGCMPVRTTVPVNGARQGQSVWVFIGQIDLPRCDSTATTGVVTLSGVLG